MLELTRPVMQRTSGKGRLAVAHGVRGTVLRELFQEGAAKIRLPRRSDRGAMEAVLINTAGGLTGGDRLDWAVGAGEGASVTLTTQACEKVYRSAGGEAEVSVRLQAAAGGRIAWLPQETILYDGARLFRTVEADLAPDARLLMVESVVFGRLARGEAVRTGVFRDRWRIRCGGVLVHGEDQRLEGEATRKLARSATGAGCAAFATVLVVGEGAADHAASVRGLLHQQGMATAGVSSWAVGGTGKLLARLAAEDSYTLRKALVPLLMMLNSEAAVPRIWSM